ncbi:hypothetical protein K432DRAFT_1508 [Lepidopterella palustris CBS 459.81]|uniref:Amino acid permease/ SLC12A domain-containing protein n=1 Tax=Lepidopterella palustris CBS 459.81 TaxID=1314670 RepID=A0A8E2JL62_9PEZI|nr:hypothetical protein K432DRAFT_1508 [Lepidopterella palustris CBS 459.81]
MASTGVDYVSPSLLQDGERLNTEKSGYDYEARLDPASIKVVYDSTRRKLKPRHIQLIGIGGTIGTALYVQIGHGLINGGPGSLFLAFTIWCSFILAVTLCMTSFSLKSSPPHTPQTSCLEHRK